MEFLIIAGGPGAALWQPARLLGLGLQARGHHVDHIFNQKNHITIDTDLQYKNKKYDYTIWMYGRFISKRTSCPARNKFLGKNGKDIRPYAKFFLNNPNAGKRVIFHHITQKLKFGEMSDNYESAYNDIDYFFVPTRRGLARSNIYKYPHITSDYIPYPISKEPVENIQKSLVPTIVYDAEYPRYWPNYVDGTLRVLQKLWKEIPGLQIYIIGKLKPYHNHYRKIFYNKTDLDQANSNSGRNHLPQEHVFNIFKKAWMYITSNEGSYEITPIEAQLAGCYIISINDVIYREHYIKGETGEVIWLNSINSAANNIRKTLTYIDENKYLHKHISSTMQSKHNCKDITNTFLNKIKS